MIKNIKLRLYLLVFITSLPFIIYTSFFHFQNQKKLQQSTLNNLSSIAQITAAEHKQIQEGARQLLISLSNNQLVISQNYQGCTKYLNNLKSNYVRYVNFGVIDSNGKIKCAADFSQATQNPPSIDLIQQTLTKKNFTIGSYYPIKPNGSVINFAFPLDTKNIVYASLSLDWVSEFVETLQHQNQNIVINILDKHGTVLARKPKSESAIGQNFATDPLVEEILKSGSGQTTKVGIDNTLRLYSFTALDDTHSTYIAVGIPQEEIYGSIHRELFLNLSIILVFISLSFVLANRIGQVLIINQIKSLENLDKLKDEFVSLASHQIRSPLTAIRWLTESLLEKPKKFSAVQVSGLQKIHTTTLRLIDLASSLLNLSRLESGVVTPQYQQTNLFSIVSPIVTDLESQAKTKNQLFKLIIPRKLNLYTDPTLLREILKIILSNAVKYSLPNTTIILHTKQKDNFINIEIQNQGIGIPESAKSNLFTRFFRADNARTHDPNGNGLGLYLAQTITKLLSGKLTFKSDNHSTIFTLSLPNKVI